MSRRGRLVDQAGLDFVPKFEAAGAGRHHEQSLTLRSVRFFRHLGIALTVFGAAGFSFWQL